MAATTSPIEGIGAVILLRVAKTEAAMVGTEIVVEEIVLAVTGVVLEIINRAVVETTWVAGFVTRSS